MVTNFGTLRAEGGSGVYLEAGGSVVNGESGSTGGLIQGGVFITGDSSGTVTNFGLISAYGGGIGISADSGTVVNFGTINGLSFDDWFQGHGVILGHGSVTNGQSGSITGDETGVRVIDSTVTNFGSIIGGTGYGVAPEAGGSVVNFGTIEGGSIGVFYVDGYGSGLPGTVTNAGTIIGDGGTAVQFGIANDRLVVDPGAVFVGTVDGGAGSDVLELTTGIGSRTLSGLGTSFANFETVVFDADAVWTVTLDNPAAFTGTISGFTAGDILDLIGRAATGVTYAGGVLTVQNGGTVVAALNLAGSYTSADFSIGPDGHGGTAIGSRTRNTSSSRPARR